MVDRFELAGRLEQIAGSLMELVAELRRFAIGTYGDKVQLVAPWVSQLGPGAEYAPGDCGPAIVAMWLRFLGHQVTVDEVSRQSGLDQGFRYTMPAHLIKAARHWGLALYWRKGLTVADLVNELDAGRPCIVLVNYPSLPTRYSSTYRDGHWLLVVGYDEEGLIYHDPYFPSDPYSRNEDEMGAFLKISLADFTRAWGNNHLNGNSDYQALRGQQA